MSINMQGSKQLYLSDPDGYGVCFQWPESPNRRPKMKPCPDDPVALHGSHGGTSASHSASYFSPSARCSWAVGPRE